MTTSPVFLELERGLADALRLHLLPERPRAEEAAFVFAQQVGGRDDELVLRGVDLELLAPDDFSLRSIHALELRDSTRARVIKRAHDLAATLVELHSHPFPYPAEFSPTDRSGLDEVVPHVRWRLRGRPYVAIVAAPDSFDALVWRGPNDARPETLAGLRVGEQSLAPTGLSAGHWR